MFPLRPMITLFLLIPAAQPPRHASYLRLNKATEKTKQGIGGMTVSRFRKELGDTKAKVLRGSI